MALISTLQQPSLEKAAGLMARALRFMMEESAADLVEIAGLIDAGKVRPVVAKTFPLEQAPQAQQFLQFEHPAGKVALKMRRNCVAQTPAKARLLFPPE